MVTRPFGIYREHATEGAPARVYVCYGEQQSAISADRYVSEGYSPAFNTLPWKEDYDTRGAWSPG